MLKETEKQYLFYDIFIIGSISIGGPGSLAPWLRLRCCTYVQGFREKFCQRLRRLMITSEAKKKVITETDLELLIEKFYGEQST